MRNLIKLLVITLLLLNICSCDDWIFPNMNKPPKENVKLNGMPAKTQIGANTFGCYINGKLMAIKGKKRVIGEDASLDWLRINSWVNGFWGEQDYSTYNISLEFLTSTSEINFMLDTVFVGKNRCNMLYYNKDPSFDPDIGSIMTIQEVDVDITYLDKKQQIICGEFDNIVWDLKAMNIYTSSGKDTTLTFSKGQFDVRYGTN